MFIVIVIEFINLNLNVCNLKTDTEHEIRYWPSLRF